MNEKGDNSAMNFLRRVGKVGGSANRDFRYAIGVDEGSSGKSIGDDHHSGSPVASSHASAVLRKSQAAYPSCTGVTGSEAGIIDDLRESFPITTIGTSWSGFTDQVMGGHSMAVLVRSADYRGRPANVLTGRVKNLPGQPPGGAAGFVQMATNLNGQSSSSSFVDASSFDGVEVDVACSATPSENGDEVPYESFNVQYVLLPSTSLPWQQRLAF
jgi:Complex I intermediate-associated protein 30 (CIA30)